VSAGWQRREVGRTRDAGWQIGVSKTIDRPVEEVWAFLTSHEGIGIWLGEGVTVLSELQLAVRSAGAGRAMLVVHQERLADAAEREHQRRHWQGVITALVAALTEPRRPTLPGPS
jgi:uncharacterized protein YndB with AHSA1/START domain